MDDLRKALEALLGMILAHVDVDTGPDKLRPEDPQVLTQTPQAVLVWTGWAGSVPLTPNLGEILFH